MAHYIAIVEDAGPDLAVGVWFPDLPGCTSAGDDLDAALHNGREALQLCTRRAWTATASRYLGRGLSRN
jgi:predicted RNase H-like HicB family nuclease